MADLKYNMSFTVGGLMLLESTSVANIFAKYRDWGKVSDEVIATNVIQAKTRSTLTRLNLEIITRLSHLSASQINLLVTGTMLEKQLLLWLAICRKYKFISEFSVEVIREKFLQLNFKVTNKDFDMFFNQKAEWHEELDSLTTATRKKLKQVLLRMAKEAGILLPNGEINRVYLSPKFVDAIEGASFSELSIFPLSDLDIAKAMGL